MTTSQDLLIVALNVPSNREVGQGDLSLALAGAELLDLVDAGVLTLEDDRLVPGAERTTGDRLLDEAGASLVRHPPYETVEDWLWRRGRGLAQAYVGVLEEETPTGGALRHWLRRRSEPAAAADSPSRRRANDRWAAHEPVLVGLADTLGIEGPSAAGPGDAADEPVVTVLAAVHDALTELEAVRQRRRIEDEAFENVWRAP
ncbi:GPP34 family phosphoprotein [Streptomyces sp. TRM70350]|uniref:GPP34 family phosphoprotein n=1 Tax=Streptomyces sp. TRM70350 TaxID=2856165 RepID=UPI001C48D294|nr:GPP34 family phosphoprotein [Streptomyces sp. TRM70350]MBV7699218.1 GPP34 family phosphoprotein [Streptomyces sp. TRM70350]